MIGLIVAVALAQASPEAEALGQRLAKAGTLASIAPALMAKETEELVTDNPDLKPEERDRLRATARRVAAQDIDKLTTALGQAYAGKLSVEDLKVLVAAAESPAAQRRRAIEPAALAAAMTSIGKLDFKGDTIAAFCAETGKLCPAK